MAGWLKQNAAGNEFKPEARPLPGEIVIAKRTNSAFIGTHLETTLRAQGQNQVVIAGVITNCGRRVLHVRAMSPANLDGEYCRVVRTRRCYFCG